MRDTASSPRTAAGSPRQRVGLWMFGVVVFVKGAMGLGSILNGHSVASTMDGIPIDTFAPAAAQTTLSLLALLGLEHVVLALVGVIALVRFRSLVPFLFALLVIEQLARRLVLWWLPIPRTGPSPGLGVNLVLLAVMVVGLVLSMRGATRRGDA